VAFYRFKKIGYLNFRHFRQFRHLPLITVEPLALRGPLLPNTVSVEA
jgi:hypothetical protein